jgi:hypothetical protein
VFAHQLQKELDEILYRVHSGRKTIEEATSSALAVCDGFTDSKMNISDVVTYAVSYLKPLPFPRAAELAGSISATHQAAQES